MLYVELYPDKVFYTTNFRLCKNYLMFYLYVTSIWRVTAVCRRYLSFNALHLEDKEMTQTTEMRPFVCTMEITLQKKKRKKKKK